jgi:hypothetical protein
MADFIGMTHVSQVLAPVLMYMMRNLFSMVGVGRNKIQVLELNM